jgi:hypothetical protein
MKLKKGGGGNGKRKRERRDEEIIYALNGDSKCVCMSVKRGRKKVYKRGISVEEIIAMFSSTAH